MNTLKQWIEAQIEKKQDDMDWRERAFGPNDRRAATLSYEIDTLQEVLYKMEELEKKETDDFLTALYDGFDKQKEEAKA